MAVNQPKTQEEYDTGRALLLATVAALGGFLFGFDTAVINGAVDAISEPVRHRRLLTGFAVASRPARLRGRRLVRRPPRGPLGRIRVMLLAAALFFDQPIGSGLAFGVWDLIAVLAHHRRPRRRHRLGDRARLHRRDRAGPRSAAGWARCSSWRSSLGIFAALLVRRRARGRGRRSRRARLVVRPRGVALDVPRRRHPGRGLRRPRAARSRSRRATSSPRADDEARAVLAPVLGTATSTRRTRSRDPPDRERRGAPVAARPARPAASACCRSSGSASCCRCSSSSSAST